MMVVPKETIIGKIISDNLYYIRERGEYEVWDISSHANVYMIHRNFIEDMLRDLRQQIDAGSSTSSSEFVVTDL